MSNFLPNVYPLSSEAWNVSFTWDVHFPSGNGWSQTWPYYPNAVFWPQPIAWSENWITSFVLDDCISNLLFTMHDEFHCKKVFMPSNSGKTKEREIYIYIYIDLYIEVQPLWGGTFFSYMSRNTTFSGISAIIFPKLALVRCTVLSLFLGVPLRNAHSGAFFGPELGWRKFRISGRFIYNFWV